MTEPMSAGSAWDRAWDAWEAAKNVESVIDIDKAPTAIIKQYGDQRVAAVLARLDDPALITLACIAYNQVYCRQPDDAKDMPECMRAAIAAIKEHLNGPA